MSDRQIRNVDCKGLFIRTMGRRRKNNAENSVKKGSAVKAAELYKTYLRIAESAEPILLPVCRNAVNAHL